MTKSYFVPVLATIALFNTTPAAADWFPYPVVERQATGTIESDYLPLAKADRPWHLCIAFPHLKDEYWLAVNYGVVSEARRQNIRLRLVEAGGYDNLARQKQQIADCAREADALAIGAISLDALNPLSAELVAAGKPVIDLVNGMTGTVTAHSRVSFEEMGYRAGEFIARRHPKRSPTVTMAWFPGPGGAGWVVAADKGLRRALTNSSVQIFSTHYGDTGTKAQSALLEQALKGNPRIDYLVGNAVMAEEAPRVKRRLQSNAQVISFYLTPGVYRGILRGDIGAAPTDSAVIQGRIAVDQAVRALERRPYAVDVGPRIQMLNADNVRKVDRAASLAPQDFPATFSVSQP